MKHTVSENIFLPIFFSAHFITRNCYISSKWVPFKLYWEINTVPLVKTFGDNKHLCICTTMNMINILMRGTHKLRNCLEVGVVGQQNLRTHKGGVGTTRYLRKCFTKKHNFSNF